MLYLIGGPPRCGKTTVARQLAFQQRCSRLPADYLSTAFQNYIPEAERQARYPAWQTATVDERFAHYTSAAIIDVYRTRAATTWPGLRDVLAYAAETDHDMVVEGYHLEPAFMAEFRHSHAQFPLRMLVLIRNDCGQLARDLRCSADPQDWVLRSATEEMTFTRIAQMVHEYSEWFRAEAAHYGLPIWPMDGAYPASIAGAVDRLTAERL